MTEPEPYYQATWYPTKTAAGKAYAPIQQIIFDEDCDLSSYRYLVPSEKKWYVVVIGQQPHPHLHERLRTILTTLTRGEPVTLDADTITFLLNGGVNNRNGVPGLRGIIPKEISFNNKKAHPLITHCP